MSKLNKEQIIGFLSVALDGMHDMEAEGLPDEDAPDRASQCLIAVENKRELAEAIEYTRSAINKLGGVI